MCFFYLAEPDVEYRLGSDEYWTYSNSNFIGENADEDDGEEAKFAGMSAREREKRSLFEIKKKYPGQKPGTSSDEEEEEEEEEGFGFSRAKMGQYGNHYRSHKYTAPKLLTNQRLVKPKKSGRPDYFVQPKPPGQQQQQHEETASGQMSSRMLKHMRRKKLRHHHHRHHSVSSSQLIKMNSTGKVRKRLKTDIKETFAPYETFGNSILKQMDQEKQQDMLMGVAMTTKKKKKKKKNKREKKAQKRALKAAREKEEAEAQRRAAMADQLFLY